MPLRPHVVALLCAGLAGLLGLSTSCGPIDEPPAGAERLPEGPWGQLSATNLLISPSGAELDRVDLAAGPVEWHLRGLSDDECAAVLATLDLPDAQFSALLETLHPTPGGYLVSPTTEAASSLSGSARRSFYARLAQDPLNRPQMNAFRYCGGNAEAWLAGWGLDEATKALISPLIYRSGGVLFFSDTWAIARIKDREERRRLIQALAAEVSLQLTLHVPAGSDAGQLAAYWSWEGDGIDLESLFRSLAGRPRGGSVDVVHLLPPFARSRLYRYPERDTVLSDGDSRDCHWTAMNFFSAAPDDRYANADAVASAMQREFEEVTQPRFGDLVAFHSGGEVYHSAVYIAADILFTRNGTRFSRPWMFIEMERMRDFYPRLEPIEMKFLRRRRAGEPEN